AAVASSAPGLTVWPPRKQRAGSSAALAIFFPAIGVAPSREKTNRAWLRVACPFRQRPLSSVEVKKSTVNRIVCSGNEGGLVRAQKQSKRRYFLGFSHAAYRLGLRESPEHRPHGKTRGSSGACFVS